MKGWQTIDGKTYYFSTSGVMQTGQKYINFNWYYFGKDGAMKTGRQVIDDHAYWFDDDGKRAKDFTRTVTDSSCIPTSVPISGEKGGYLVSIYITMNGSLKEEYCEKSSTQRNYFNHCFSVGCYCMSAKDLTADLSLMIVGPKHYSASGTSMGVTNRDAGIGDQIYSDKGLLNHVHFDGGPSIIHSRNTASYAEVTYGYNGCTPTISKTLRMSNMGY